MKSTQLPPPQSQDASPRCAMLAVLMAALYGGSAIGGIGLSVIFRFPQDPVGGNPPWYYIRSDLLYGVAMAIGLLIAVAIGLSVRTRCPMYGNALIWMSILWNGPFVWKAIVILSRTSNVFDPARATTSWATFNEYVRDPRIWGGQAVVLSLGAVLAYVLQRGLLRNSYAGKQDEAATGR
jgi:hypothetical protein